MDMQPNLPERSSYSSVSIKSFAANQTRRLVLRGLHCPFPALSGHQLRLIQMQEDSKRATAVENN